MSDTTRPIWLQRLFDFRGQGVFSQQEADDMLDYIETLEGERARAERLAAALKAIRESEHGVLPFVSAEVFIEALEAQIVEMQTIAGDALKALDGGA